MSDPLTIVRQRRSLWFQLVTFVLKIVMAVEANVCTFDTF
jgi:hypothetical protein